MQIKYNGDVIPCCYFTLGYQYSRRDNPRVFGNVPAGSVADVWNSEACQRCRRLVCRPSVAGDEARENFCYACTRLYYTDYAQRTCRWAKDYTFDDLYTLDQRGRPPSSSRDQAGGPAGRLLEGLRAHQPNEPPAQVRAATGSLRPRRRLAKPRARG